MTYATVANIESEFKNMDFTATSPVLTAPEIVEFINEEEAYINTTVENRYEVPVTDSESILILKKISIAFVAYRVAKILNLKKEVPIPAKFVPQQLNEGAAYLEAKKQLAEIKSGKLILNSAIARAGTQGIKSYNSVNSISPLWERDKKQW